MASLIVKSPYIKDGDAGGGPGGYLKYIGTREGVELLPSGYMEYMAERPRSHGLFGDEDAVDMSAAMKELNEYPGNIWTHVISLKHEDAERLGYDHAAQWRNLIRAHCNYIVSAMNIPPSDFRWYAAFHDEGGHPHIHMMAWSAKPGQAYLSKDGIRKIKSALTSDIFNAPYLRAEVLLQRRAGAQGQRGNESSGVGDVYQPWAVFIRASLTGSSGAPLAL